MAKKKVEKNNTINIKSQPVQAHIGAARFANDDWGTIAFSFPRTDLSLKFIDKELRYNSIYFLFGYEDGHEVAYVGQALKRKNGESALVRLREHDKSTTEPYRDKWSWVIVVTNKDDTWGATELNALESIFIQEVPEKNNLNGRGQNNGGADISLYEDKVTQIKALITAIGFKIFEDIPEKENIQVISEVNEYSIVEDLQNGMARIPEIVTPDKIVKAMVDMLPAEVWNSKTKFLDPACKGGEYLREIYDRLMKNETMQSAFPNDITRSNHILKNQIYGIALSQVSLDRTTKKLFGEDRNIKIIPDYINKLKGINMGSRPDGKQNNIGDILNKEFGKDMEFDVVIGNPPYQESTGGGINGGRALYNFFIDNALTVANIVSFIVPSRWMSDKPNGLENNWLSAMRERDDFVKVIDYADSSDCFKGVAIAGGVCIFIIDKNYHGDAYIKYIGKNEVCERVGQLAYKGIVIRNQRIQSIVEKVNTAKENSLYTIIGTNRQFSPNDNYFATNWTGFSVIKTDENYIRYFANSRVMIIDDAYISESDLPDGTLWLAKTFKLFLPLTGPTSNQIVNPPFIGGTDSCCSRTYAPVYGDAVDNEEKANNCIKYWKTKFLRILVSAVKTTQHATRLVYQLVPLQDFSSSSDIDWSQSISNIDQQLYKKYNLSDEEIAYIESTIKPME